MSVEGDKAGFCCKNYPHNGDDDCHENGSYNSSLIM